MNDPLKSLREIRFSIENNFQILSIERIIYEFNKILLDKNKNPSKGIFFYYKIGLLLSAHRAELKALLTSSVTSITDGLAIGQLSLVP
ncbi:MAG: hypothetical protein ACTTMZ_00560 [Candidatus Karelsulcia muelleri]